MKRRILYAISLLVVIASCQKDQVKTDAGIVYVESLNDKNKRVTHEEYLNEFKAAHQEKTGDQHYYKRTCWVTIDGQATQGKMCTTSEQDNCSAPGSVCETK